MKYHGLPKDKRLQGLFAKANAADAAAGLAIRKGDREEYAAQHKAAKRAWYKFFMRRRELNAPVKGQIEKVSQIMRKIS
jgi:hypothetical protein